MNIRNADMVTKGNQRVSLKRTKKGSHSRVISPNPKINWFRHHLSMRPCSFSYSFGHCLPLEVLKVSLSLPQRRDLVLTMRLFSYVFLFPLLFFFFNQSHNLFLFFFTIPSLCHNSQPPALSSSTSLGLPMSFICSRSVSPLSSVN